MFPDIHNNSANWKTISLHELATIHVVFLWDHLQDNNFLEPDGKKSGPDEFIKRFDILINDIKEHGIDKTIIPITKNGEIIDGAHRLSVALYLKLKVKFAIFDLLDANYNRDFFIRRGFNIKYAEIIDKEVIDKIK